MAYKGRKVCQHFFFLLEHKVPGSLELLGRLFTRHEGKAYFSEEKKQDFINL